MGGDPRKALPRSLKIETGILKNSTLLVFPLVFLCSDSKKCRKIRGSLSLELQKCRKIRGSLSLELQKCRKIRGSLCLELQKCRKIRLEFLENSGPKKSCSRR